MITKRLTQSMINQFNKSQNPKLIYLEANGSYTVAHFLNHHNELISYRIGKVQRIIKDCNFIRCHRSYSINIQFIEEVCLKKRIVKLINGEIIKISRRKIKKTEESLFQKLDILG